MHVYSPIAHTFSLKICVKIVLKNLFFSQLCILEETFEDDSDKGRYQVSVRPAIKTMCHQNYVSVLALVLINGHYCNVNGFTGLYVRLWFISTLFL